MRASAIPTATLLALLCAGCGDTPPPRPAIATFDRATVAPCLALDPKAPALPAHDQVTLPDGRRAYLADTAKARDTIAARFILALSDAFRTCRNAAGYADRWAVGVAADRD
jgi:hypothetical protein